MSAPNDSLPVTDRLAAFVSELTWEVVPAAIRDLLPILLVDVFRVGSVGQEQAWTKAVFDLYRFTTSRLQASVLFADVRVDAQRAAFINGVACGSLEWDDSHVAAIVHPGVVVWPAALALAEATGASGREFLTAAVAGYEVSVRLGMAIQPEHSMRGFQGTMTCGAFGAAAAAARLLRLDPLRTRNALGIAASFSSGLSQFFISGSDVKRVHAAKAAANGLEAALLARAGLSGPHDAIEGKQGFGRAFSDRFDAATVVDGLGVRFPTRLISLKPHAGSVRMQAAIEAAAALATDGIRPEAVVRIEIGVHRAMVGKLTGQDPADQQAAQLSAPFAVAMALVLSSARPPPLVLSPSDFAQCLANPVVRDLARRTTCVVDDQVQTLATDESMPGRVTCELRGGEKREKFIRYAKGGPKNPLTLAEACERFRVIAAPRFGAGPVQAWLDHALSIDRHESIEALFSLRADVPTA